MISHNTNFLAVTFQNYNNQCYCIKRTCQSAFNALYTGDLRPAWTFKFGRRGGSETSLCRHTKYIADVVGVLPSVAAGKQYSRHIGGPNR